MPYGKQPRHRVLPWAATVAVCLILAAAVGFIIAQAVSSGTPSASATRAELTDALRHLTGEPESAQALAPYVQGADTELADALAAAATKARADSSFVLPKGTATVSTVRITSADTATVDFALKRSGPNGYVSHFVGTATLSGGRWRISWVTVCMLVEQEGVLCPNPPPGVSAPLPLPYSQDALAQEAVSSPDLLRPQALALTPGGDLLIADSYRDQVLEWQPDGTLTVFAGTGQPGFSGDGGPALDARLEDPGGMAFAPDGTLYFVDGNRIRAVSPTGRITTVAGNGLNGPPSRSGPALDSSLNPSDVAVSGNGTLYIATNSQIVEVSSSGTLSVFVQGGPPYGVDVTTQGGLMAFFPTKLAFDGAGNLDVFSFSPKELFQISPVGKITALGTVYATQLAEASDGDVLVAGHGGTISRVSPAGLMSDEVDLRATRIVGFGVAGQRGGFQPDGIAVDSSGAVFVDTFYGNGWTEETALAEIEPDGTAHVLPIRTPLLDTLPPRGAPGFPEPVYPSPVPSRSRALVSCPNSGGLQPFDPVATAAARAAATRFNAFSSSFYGDLASSDRSWWTGLFATWAGPGYDRDTHTVMAAGHASQDPFQAAVSSACGAELVRDSLVLDVGPSAYSFQVSHLYFLDRRGRPLVYFQAS